MSSSQKKAEDQKISPVSDGYKEINIGIPPPPDHIFKYRQKRQNVAQGIWGKGTISYIPYRAEYIPGEGNFVYYSGITEEQAKRYKIGNHAIDAPRFPSRCVAPVDAIYAVNSAKRAIMTQLKLFSSEEMKWPMLSLLILGKKKRKNFIEKAIRLFKLQADLTMNAFWLKDEYYCPLANEARKFVAAFLCDLGVSYEAAWEISELAAAAIEFDNAYRFRLHDLANEADPAALKNDFLKEAHRLLALLKKRENKDMSVYERFAYAEKILLRIWKLPSARRALTKASAAVQWEKVKLSEADIYHQLLYGDYDTQGKTQEERFEIYRAYHGKDIGYWPQRIMISSN